MTRPPVIFVLTLMTVCAWPAEFSVGAGDLGKRMFALKGVNAGPGHVKGYPEMKLTV